MSDYLELTSGLDQFLPLLDMEKKVFGKVDDAVVAAVSAEDMQPIWNMGVGLNAIGKASGLGMAKLAYDGLQVWLRLELGEEKEYYEAAMVGMGRHKQTVVRGVAIWKMFEDEFVPDYDREKMYTLGVKMLAPIAQAVKEGHEIPSEKWLALSECVDEAEVRDVIKQITGKEKNSNNRKLFIDVDGDITVVTKKEIAYVGHLDVTSKSALVLETIERIKNGNAPKMLEK